MRSLARGGGNEDSTIDIKRVRKLHQVLQAKLVAQRRH